MVEDFAPKNLRARLAAVQDRLSQARTQLEARGIVDGQTDALADFIKQHDAIRGSLDIEGTITELQHSKATAQTDALEAALSQWLEGIESAFNSPGRRGPNISM